MQLIRREGYLNSKIQIHGRVATVGKRHFGLYKDLVLIVGGGERIQRVSSIVCNCCCILVPGAHQFCNRNLVG